MELNTHLEDKYQIRMAPFGGSLSRTEGLLSQPGLVEERLPFRVRIVRCEEDLEKAVSIRHVAYGRHLPAVAALLERPEACDSEPGSAVLLAESKMDGSPLGTMRIQTNRYGSLALEDSVKLPSWLDGKSQAEATRLGVTSDRLGRLVKTALFKAYYQYCLLEDIEWMVITARSPLDRQYEALLFEDVHPGRRFTPMRHVGNIPHRVLAFNVERAEANWRQARHPLYGFVFCTRHADIDRRGTERRSAGGATVEHSDRRGTVQHADRRGTVEHADRRGTIQHSDRRETARHPDRRGTVQHSDRRGTVQHSDRRGTVQHCDRREASRRSLADRRQPPLTGARNN